MPLESCLSACRLEAACCVSKHASGHVIVSQSRVTVTRATRQPDRTMDVELGHPRCRSTNTRHEVVRASSGDDLENDLYLVARLPLGNYVIHCWSANRSDGYGDAAVKFLTERDGMKTVKGPYLMSFLWRDYKKLVKFLERPELYNIVCKIAVGTLKPSSVHQGHFDLVDRVYEEVDWRPGPILPRIRGEWHRLHVWVWIQTGHPAHRLSAKVAQLLEKGEDQLFNIDRPALQDESAESEVDEDAD